MKRMWIPLLFGLLAGMLAACGGASQALALNIEDVWARPGSTGGNGAVYFVIDNPTGEADSLLRASGDIAQSVELHESVMKDDGTMSMVPQEQVPVAAGSQVAFKPGGLHVMLVNLQQDLAPGDQFPLTLTFQNAGEIEIQATVREP